MDDESLMSRCLQLAQLGQGFVAPNPMVGSVVFHDGKIIGEGWHREFGMPHAEVNALKEIKDKEILSSSILYVNLEPCSHHGKTPPCADEIIRQGIKKVVIGMKDPNPEVNGKGIQKLKDAGIEVVVNVLQKECLQLNKRFITFHENKRPYLILKWAQSIDGYIGRENERIQISNELSTIITHRWRSEESAIMVGTKTIQTDNPHLSVRNWFGKQPLRITIDKQKSLTRSSPIFDGSQSALIYTYLESEKNPLLEYEKLNPNEDVLKQIMQSLYQRKIQSVLIEGGAVLFRGLIAASLWDEARIFYSPILLKSGIKAPETSYSSFTEELIGDNRLLNLFT